MVFEPPHTLVQEIEKRLVAFFGGVVKSPALFLPLSEGGQRLIDIKNCIRVFLSSDCSAFLIPQTTNVDQNDDWYGHLRDFILLPLCSEGMDKSVTC